MSAIQAADVPTLNQNTSGTAAGLSATLVATSGGTGQSTYVLGDVLYASSTTALSKLSGSVSATTAFLSQTGNGTVSAAPVWTTSTGTGSVVRSAGPTLTGTTNVGALTSSGTIQTSFAQGVNPPNTGQAYFFNPTNSANQDASCAVRIAGATARYAYYSYDVSTVAGYSHGILGSNQNLVFRASWDMSSATLFTMDRTGNFTATGNITSSSDRRIKTDIRRIEGALDKVTQISGYTFTRTDETNKGARQAGVIAQEIIEVLPEVVQKSEETGHYSVSYGNITALLIEALKEERLERLKLEERLARLEKLVHDHPMK
jgi:hypothetical protein